jgi:hypothetical protein
MEKTATIATKVNWDDAKTAVGILQNAMDIGIMFLLCVVVISGIIFYIWQIRPRIVEIKKSIDENNVALREAIENQTKATENNTLITQTLITSIQEFSQILAVQSEKINSVHGDINCMQRDIVLVHQRLDNIQRDVLHSDK